MKLHRSLEPDERNLLSHYLTKTAEWAERYGGWIQDKVNLAKEEVKLTEELFQLEEAAAGKTSGIVKAAQDIATRRQALEMMERAKAGQNSRLRLLLEEGRDLAVGMRSTIREIAAPMLGVRRREIIEQLLPFFKSQGEAEGIAAKTVQVQILVFYFQMRDPIDGTGLQAVVTDEGALFDDEETSHIPGPWSTQMVTHFIKEQAAAMGRLLKGDDLVPEFDREEYAAVQAQNARDTQRFEEAHKKAFEAELSRA
jgi:hypothetical protein